MTHGLIRASVPLMETALATAWTLPDDPVAVLLTDYLEHHIPEERGHHAWLLEALESLGVPGAGGLGGCPHLRTPPSSGPSTTGCSMSTPSACSVIWACSRVTRLHRRTSTGCRKPRGMGPRHSAPCGCPPTWTRTTRTILTTCWIPCR